MNVQSGGQSFYFRQHVFLCLMFTAYHALKIVGECRAPPPTGHSSYPWRRLHWNNVRNISQSL